MKKIAFFITISLFAALACDKMDSVSDGRDYPVSFNLIGEIETTEEPLTRAEGGSNDLYAIQVYQGSTVFAWGIFDHLSGITVNLKQGSTYSVKIVKVNDAKTLLGSNYSLVNDGINCVGKSAAGPFRVYNGTGSFTPVYYVRTNVFYYKFAGYFQYYDGASTTTVSTKSTWYYLYNITEGSLNDVKYPTCNDWLYGASSGFSPNGETRTWYIRLKRAGFKLKYELSGVTDGSVTVKIKNSSRTFFNNTTTTPTFESATHFNAFYDAASAWQYADNYMENLTVSVSWARGIGVTQNLGSKVVSIKRNCLNNIKITLGNDDRGAGVSLSTEDDSSMNTSENTVIIQ